MTEHTPVAVIGAGLTGMATAARLAARGRGATVFESHRTVGGCASYFRRRGFAFDVGSTTLVDYVPGGVGGRLLSDVGLPDSLLEHLPGYLAWLPDVTIELPADPDRWRTVRAKTLGDTPGHRKLWTLVDRLARAFIGASRRHVRMPIRTPRDLVCAIRSMPPHEWPLLRYLRWTLDDALAWAGVREDARLRAFMSIIVQDTVHNDTARAPLVNASLGLAIRGAIARPHGGMYGFWRAFEARAIELGVDLRLATAVESVRAARRGERGRFVVRTEQGETSADVVVCTLPIWDAARVGPPEIAAALEPWCRRDESNLAGAALLTMGVPEEEVRDQAYTHHQFLPDADAPLGEGNNCFLSISSPDDRLSAPEGWRAVMISTHVELEPWMSLDAAAHAGAKARLGTRLLEIVRRAYPGLGRRAEWLSVASPRTYAKFTRRHRGSVGGVRLSLHNSNQRAVPHHLGVPGWIQAGDTTWPGLGTTAAAICSRMAADDAWRISEGGGRCRASPTVAAAT